MQQVVKMFDEFAKFLEEYPLYRKLALEPLWEEWSVWLKARATPPPRISGTGTGPPKFVETPTVHMSCDLCRSAQTFVLLEGQRDEQPPTQAVEFEQDNVSLLVFRCAGCQVARREFLLEFNKEQKWLRKVGEYPRWQAKLDRREAELLGDYEALYRQGLACEREAFGIGASAYYRRIVEGVIDRLLESIKDLIDESEQPSYVEALKRLQKDTVAAEKVKCAKDYLPSTLRPGGINPLDILYGHLSTDLHTKDDEECLSDATDIRRALLFLLTEVAAKKEQAKTFRESTGRLLGKRSKQPD